MKLTLQEWVDEHAMALQRDIETHLSHVTMSEQDTSFLLRMILISVRAWRGEQ